MPSLADYQDLKHLVASATGQNYSLLHIHAGLAIYLLCQILLGTRRASLPALLLVVQLEVANECLDRATYGSWRWDDTLSDFALTVFWPAVLALVSWVRRRRWRARQRLRNFAVQPAPRPEAA